MTVYMTVDRWITTHKDFKGHIGGRNAVVTETGIDYVEIVDASDDRVDNTGYGRVA